MESDLSRFFSFIFLIRESEIDVELLLFRHVMLF